MNTVITAFTRKGTALAQRLAVHLDAKIFVPSRLADDGLNAIDAPLTEWAGRHFHASGSMVFIGACGIAIRAIAPYVNSKMLDPAVIVIDEAGRYVIPVLSGHVGGANTLAREIASFLGAQAVITTATDVNHLPAVDEWAVNHDCVIENPGAIKHVSSSLLEGHSVGVAVTDELMPSPFPVTLWLRPKVLVLGAGCNKGTDPAEFERSAMDFLNGAGVSVLSLKAIASIDIKAHEGALLDFSRAHGLPFMTFTASELQALQGKFTASEVVRNITGTDNVCERAAVMAAGDGAVLMRSKTVYGGITFALARVRRIENDITA